MNKLKTIRVLAAGDLQQIAGGYEPSNSYAFEQCTNTKTFDTPL